jgi:maltooligosyltrehalose trehalohydrolase
MGRKVQLMAESDLNDPRLIRPPEHGGYGLDAQWSDDVHHTIHATLTGERHGYYQDFTGIATIADVYREPFFYARRYAPHRDRVTGDRRPACRASGSSCARRTTIRWGTVHWASDWRRSFRRSGSGSRRRWSAVPLHSAVVHGEEYGETAPFVYFIEHGDPALIEAVRAGRRREFERSGCPAAAQLDPQSEETFARVKLDWDRRESASGALLLALYMDLLALRRENQP